jgi:ABC-type antimicrobial peptide transport system permease subunit
MFKNYFKIAIRNLAKHRTHSWINIFGLSLAFLCSILLFLNAWFELSFDDFYPDKDRIYKVYCHSMGPDGLEDNASMPYPVASAVKAEIPLIESATRYIYNDKGLEYKGKQLDVRVNLVDDDFLKVLASPVISGSKTSPLKDPGNVVLTESAATRIFGKEDPIGKTVRIKVQEEPQELVVSAVIKDFPANSSFKFDVLARTELRSDYAAEKNNWNMWNHDVYVKLSKTASRQSVEKSMSYLFNRHTGIDTIQQKKAGYVKDENGMYNSLRLLPVDEIHFDNNIGSGNSIVSKTYIYTLLLISFLVLAIACFNFINLNIARAFTRTKEVGVRKSLGASRKQIFLQVWGESLIICVASVLVGIIAAVFLFPSFNQLFAAKLSLSFFYQPSSIIMLLLSILIISLCAGGYPALVISRLSVSGVLRGNVSLKKPGLFRNSLIILQFTIACLLMSCTLIAYKQFSYMREMPLGFNKEAVISFPVQSDSGRGMLAKFRNRLASQTSIISMTGSSINLGLGKDGSISKWTKGFEHNGKDVSTNWMTVDYDFLKTAGIVPVKGRDFDRAYGTDTSGAVVVTESMVKQLGVEDPIGFSFLEEDSAAPRYTIIGVIPDFHLYSLHEKKEPLTMQITTDFDIQYILIKTKSNNPTQVMSLIEKTFKEIQPDKEFKGSFLDENVDRWYQRERRLSILLGISAVIAVILSCLGLFALALLMTQQRIKEIGVRKVLGASVASINNLLTKDFLKLVLIAIVIATPVAWWLMNKWLQDFPYHTTITWLIFVLVGLSAVFISITTISFHTIKAAVANPVKSLRTE